MIEDIQFDIEKVESLDYDKLSNQLKYIFQSEKDIVSFINFLRNIYNFVNLSNDKRHMSLQDLVYFKSQIQLLEKKIKLLIDKKRSEQTKDAIKKAKCCGEKITESIISYYEENTSALNGLEELYILVSSWSSYMNDLYFLCSQTNKNVGAFA